jgi:hypothetical protein
VRRGVAAGAALFALALGLRLWHLDAQSIWLDEGITWWYATHGTWGDTLLAEPNHPPGWVLATRAWLSVFPATEASLRMLPALLGALSVVLAWRLALRLLPPAAALAAALLAAVNPFWIAQSQEARMYAALLAESLGATLLYLRWRDLRERGEPARGTLVLYAALASLALHTHYYAIWPLLSHGAHATWRRLRGDGVPVRPLVLAHVAAAASFLPWFLHVRSAFRGIQPTGEQPLLRLFESLWRMGAGPGLAARDAARNAAGDLGALVADPVRATAAAVLWFVPIAFGVRAFARDRALRPLLVAFLLLPLLAVLAVSLRWTLVREHHLVFLAPWLLLAAVAGAFACRGAARAALLAALALLHVAGFLAYHLPEREPVRAVLGGGVPYAKEAWRDAHALVSDPSDPSDRGDVVLVHARFTTMPWAFYDRPGDPEAFPLPPRRRSLHAALTPAEILEAVPRLRDADRVRLVLSHESVPGHYRGAVLDALASAWGAAPDVAETLFPAGRGIRVLRARRR